jgi:serine/threonine-protein kinase HipA
MSERRLEVYLYGKKSGILSDNDGVLSYRYDKEAKDPLSLRMPVREEAYGDRECRPFFENLLPEGEVRQNVAVKERVSEGNVFSLLDSIGGDCAGAVSLYREGKKGTDNQDRRPVEIQDEE